MVSGNKGRTPASSYQVAGRRARRSLRLLLLAIVTLLFANVGLALWDGGTNPGPPGISPHHPSPVPQILQIRADVGAPPGYGLTNPAALQPRGPIHIDGNASYTTANGVRSGTGTKQDPYIISDWLIDMTNFPNVTAGVWIEHASKYAIVRNVQITNIQGSGNFFGVLLGTSTYPPVKTNWAENITVTHILINRQSRGYGIQSSYSTKNNNISFSAVYMNITARDWQYGITCQGGSQNCVIWGNYVDARVANTQTNLRTVGIQTGDGCMVNWGIGFVLPCATVTVARNTVTNATSEALVSDGTTRSSFFSNLGTQNYPGRRAIPGISRGILVESRSNYTSVHDNVFSGYNNGIELGGWGGRYWNNTVHDNDWGVVVDTNNSFANVAFTLYNTIWNTNHYNNGNGDFIIPPGQSTVLLDGKPGVTPSNFPFQLINQGGQTISGAGYLWRGTRVTAWYTLTAWGYMSAITINDEQSSSTSQNLSGAWYGANLGLSVSEFTSSDVRFTISASTDASFQASGLTPAAYYQVYLAGSLQATIPTTVDGNLSLPVPLPSLSLYELRFSSTVPAPTVSISAPANGSYSTLPSVSLFWTVSDSGPGIQSVYLSLDGGTGIDVTGQSTYTLSGVADGRHVVTVTASDRTGLSARASVAVTVDTHPPTVRILTPENGTTVSGSTLLLAWNATDAVSGLQTVEIALDDGPPLTATGRNYTLGGLTAGPHQVAVTAVDNAGLRATATAAFTVSLGPAGSSGNSTSPGNSTPSSNLTPAVTSVAYLPQSSAVDIAFTQPMNHTSVEQSLAVAPNVEYSLQWVNDSHVRIVLHSSLSEGSLYQVTLQPSAKTFSGSNLQHPFLFQFLVPGQGGTGPVPALTWLPIILIITVLLLTINWATAGYLVVHYRTTAGRLRKSLNRFSKRYAGSLIVVYKRLATGAPNPRKASRRSAPKPASRKGPPKGPVTKLHRVPRKVAEPTVPRWRPPGGHR